MATCGTAGASADNGKIRIREETTFGVAVAANPKFDSLRFTSESLKQDTGTAVSNEIDGERNTNDVTRSSVGASGDIAFELSYQSLGATDKGMDILWKAAFQATAWTARVAFTGTNVTFEASTTTGPNAQIKRAAGSWTADGFLANRIISIQGSSVAGNNCFARIITAGTTDLDVKPLNTAGDFVDDLTAGESVTVVQGPQITNAKTCRAYNVEVEFTDLVNVFKQMLGMVPSTGNITIPLEGNVTGSIGFLGSKETSGTATLGDGSPAAPEATDVMSSVDNVLIFTENLAQFDILSFGLAMNNNLRQRRKVGSPGVLSIGAGRLSATGTLTAYFANSTFYDKYLSFTQTGFITILRDNASNAYALDLPAVKLSAGQRIITGTNTDVIADMGYIVKKHATDGFMVRLTRFDAADTP